MPSSFKAAILRTLAYVSLALPALTSASLPAVIDKNAANSFGQGPQWSFLTSQEGI